jgi:hypothetical protein
MLVYSPNALPHIFRSLITDFRPSLRNADPAQSLFLLCRFASLWGDPDWIEDLIAGAVDKIEEAVYVCFLSLNYAGASSSAVVFGRSAVIDLLAV